MTDKLMDQINAWDGKSYENIDCFRCDMSGASFKYRPFCSERCWNTFDDHMPLKAIHALYAKIKHARGE